jgi:hypothetical protein
MGLCCFVNFLFFFVVVGIVAIENVRMRRFRIKGVLLILTFIAALVV